MNSIITAPIIAQTVFDVTHTLKYKSQHTKNKLENHKMKALIVNTTISSIAQLASQIHGQTLAYRQATERTEAEFEIASQHHQRELQKIANDQQNAKRHMKMVKKGHAKYTTSLEVDKADLRKQLKKARKLSMNFNLSLEERQEMRQYANELQDKLDGMNDQYHRVNNQLADNLRLRVSAGGQVYDGDFVEKDD